MPGPFYNDGFHIADKRDLFLEISRGNVKGYASVNKFGRNPSIDTNTDPEDIWDGGGLWVPPNTAIVHNIASTVSNDTGTVLSSGTATGGSTTTLEDTNATFLSDGVAAGDTVIIDINKVHATVISATETILTTHVPRHGKSFSSGDVYRVVTPASTGASIIHVSGLGSDMLPQEEFIVLNGTNDVPTLNPYWRIFRMHIDGSAGRTSTNIGNVTATTDDVAATVTAQISAGKGQTLMAVYTIPAGKTGYMVGFYATMNRGAGAASLADLSLLETPFASVDGSGTRTKHFLGLITTGSSQVQHMFLPYKKFEEQTDIWIRCESVTANSTDISAGFDLILIDN